MDGLFHNRYARLEWMALIFLTLWVSRNGVLSTRGSQGKPLKWDTAPAELRPTNVLRQHLIAVGSLSRAPSFFDDENSALPMQAEQEKMDTLLLNAEIPLEVQKKGFKRDDIRALGLFLTTARTFINKNTQRNIFLVLSSYYKISLSRTCAVAYGLGFLFSRADQVAGIAGILVTTLTSLFLNRRKHNLYAGLISNLRLSVTVASSLGGFVRHDYYNPNSYTHSPVLSSVRNAVELVVRDVLPPSALADIINIALGPMKPSTSPLINYSTGDVDVGKFKKSFPFTYFRSHNESPVHLFTAELRKPNTTYWTLAEKVRSVALPILVDELMKRWDTLANYYVYPLMETVSVKAQELTISVLERYAFKLPNLLEWSNRNVDYRALLATNWDPLVGALSNWEAKDETYTKHGLHWRTASRMKQMYLLFVQQAQRASFFPNDSPHPVIRTEKASCMSQFVAHLKAAGSPRLQAALDRIQLPRFFLTWELVNDCFATAEVEKCNKLPVYFSSVNGTKLVLSVSDEAVPVEFELRIQPTAKDIKILESFPKGERPRRTPFGYAEEELFAAYPKAGFFGRIRRQLIVRAKQLLSPFLKLAQLAQQTWQQFLRHLQKSHGSQLTMKVAYYYRDPNFLTLELKHKGKTVKLEARPLHMLQSIDPVRCRLRDWTPFHLNYFNQGKELQRLRGASTLTLPANRVQIFFPKGKLNSHTQNILLHVLPLLFPVDVAHRALNRFIKGLETHVWRLNDMDEIIECLKKWYRAKKLFSSRYKQISEMKITQHISEWYDYARQMFENQLRRNGVDGKHFRDSWTVILNSSEDKANYWWEVIELDTVTENNLVVKRYEADFGTLAVLASAAEAELKLVAGTDHVLKRMQSSLFDYAHMQTLFIESPGTFLQHLLTKGSQQTLSVFETWLLRRLHGHTQNKTCGPGSFYGKAYAQYESLVNYYAKKDLAASVPDVREIKLFLLTGGLPKGSLVRIRPEDDMNHSGLYRMIQRVDRCTFLLEDANGLQVITDATLHVVRRFEDGDQISHRSNKRLRFNFIHKNAETGVCTIKDDTGYEFKLEPAQTTQLTVGRFSHQSKRLRSGNLVLASSRLAYNTLLGVTPNFVVEFDVEQKIIQDCYSGLTCVVRNERNLPVKIHYAMADEHIYAWAGSWLWLFLNGLHSEYLSILSSVQLVRSREDGFWIQRTVDELGQSCWDLDAEASLSLNRNCLTATAPGFLSRLFTRCGRKQKPIPNRCAVTTNNPSQYFPGAPTHLETRPGRSPERIFGEQTKRMVSCMSSAAYMLRKDMAESAMLALKQHFRQRVCGGPLSCASWWLKARELKGMVRRLSETGHKRMAHQEEWLVRIKSFSSTPLSRYWITRICALEQNFRQLFTRLRLPEELQGLVPCSKVSALVILATAMSEITLLIRRRSIAAGKKRVHHINKLLSFLELNKVPVPCSPGVPREPGSSQPRAAGTAATDKECQKRAATMNTFMHMKSLIDAVHIQIDDVIQLLRTMFTPVLYSRLSPGFISNNEHEYRNQATKFRETDEEIADLYASLLHPFEVWQGTFRNRQREEFLEINMRLQCPFRPPKQTQHRKELVSGSTIELIQGFLPFGYKDAEKVILENRAAQRKEQTILLFTGLFLLQVAARGDDFASSLVKFILNEQAFEVALKHTTWPLLDFLQHQSILISSEPSVISSLQCNALESLRWGLRKLGLGNEAVTVQPVQQVLQTMLNDANFSEVASFLPPPVEAVDSVAFPLGFLHIQSTMLLYSILVTPSGDALFGNIPEFPSTPSAGSQDNRTLVTLKKGNGSLLLEDPVSKQTFKFEDPRGCNPGSQQSVKFLRYLWRTIWNSLKSGYFPQSNSDPWFARAKKYVDDVIKQNKFDALCEDQKDILVEELLKAMSHNTPLHEGATVWNGSSLVVLDRIRDGVSYVRPAGPLGTKAKQVATTDTLFHSKKLHVGDEVQVAVSGNRVKYVLLYLAPISRTGCVSKLRRLDSGEIILWREPLIRVHGFEMGELVRKALSIEVYQYLGTCGHYYKLKNFVTGLVEWTTEDLLPLWAPIYHDDLGTTQSELANVYPPKELHMNLIVFLREFSRTKESRISLSDFRKVLRLLISHNLLTDDQAKALQHTFDKREKKDEFDKTVLSVKQLASRLLSALRKTLISNCSAAEEKQWLFVWGNATVAALEAMWRTRHLWRTLHKIHREGLNQFFTEVSNVPQIPDLTKAMKDKSFNMERVKKKGRDIIVQHTSASRNPSSLPSLCQAMPKASDQRDAHLCLFVNFVAESVTPKDDLKKLLSSTKKEETLKLWDDYCTAVEDRLKDFASQQKAMQNICEKLRKKDSAFPQSSPVSSWADAVLLRVSETIGSIMKDSLGTKVSSSAIESALKPVILQELVEVSGLSFDNKSDIERLFGNLSEYLATEISKTYQIQNPGRVPRGDVLLNVLSLLEVEEHDVKQLEKQIRHQYSQLTQKYVDQLVSDELINTDGVLDMIGALEKALASLVTPVVDRALGLVKKAARFFLKPKRRIRHFLFGFNKMAEFLDKTVAEEPPTDTDIESLEFVIENETLDDTTPPQKPMGTIKRSVGRFLMKGALGTSSAALYVLHSFNVTFAHHLRHIPHIFWTPIVRGALEIGIKAALSIFVGPDAKQYIKLVQDSIWISGIQPWFESLKLQCDILGKLLKGIQEGQNLSHNWWRELPLLVFIKQSLDDARLSLFDPSNLYTIWSQIKYATSSSSSLFKVLMTPVKDLGVYLYLLLVKLLDGVLPSENGDFLVPREPYEEEQNNNPVMDIAVANPPDLIKYLHRLFDVILKVYVPMVRKLFDNIIQLVLQKVAYRSKNDRSLLELWRIINHIAGYDVDFEIENIFRETFSGVIDSLFQRWPTLPVGSPLTWQ